MAIVFKCEFCGKKISAPDHLAGKSAKCPTCQKQINIPLPEPKVHINEDIEEIPLAPEDPQEEMHQQQLRREQFMLEEALAKHKESPEPPAGSSMPSPAESALPLTDDDEAFAFAMQDTSSQKSASADANQLIEKYILLMIRGKIAEASALANQIVAGGSKTQQKVEEMAMQDFLHPEAASIPPTVIAGFFKKLLAQFP